MKLYIRGYFVVKVHFHLLQDANYFITNPNFTIGFFSAKKTFLISILSGIIGDLFLPFWNVTSVCQEEIGYLNPYEECDCYGITNGLAIVCYKIDGSTIGEKKVGFVKWLDGVM